MSADRWPWYRPVEAPPVRTGGGGGLLILLVAFAALALADAVGMLVLGLLLGLVIAAALMLLARGMRREYARGQAARTAVEAEQVRTTILPPGPTRVQIRPSTAWEIAAAQAEQAAVRETWRVQR